MQVFAQCKPHFNHQLPVLWHGGSRSQRGARTRTLFPGTAGCGAAPMGLCQGGQGSAHTSQVALYPGCSPPLALHAARSVSWVSPAPSPDPTDCPNACSSCLCMGRVHKDLSPAPKPWQAGPAPRDTWEPPTAAPCVPAASGHHRHVHTGSLQEPQWCGQNLSEWNGMSLGPKPGSDLGSGLLQEWSLGSKAGSSCIEKWLIGVTVLRQTLLLPRIQALALTHCP